jgi:hypothetical protein
MKLNKRIKYLHIRIKNGVRQTHTAYRELSESEVKRVPNRYWVDDLPKPMKRIKKEVEKKKHIHRYKVYGSTAVCKCGQIKVKSSPKPTKIEKKLVIKEEWCETTFEQQKDRLHVHMRYFEDDDNGGKWEGGSSSFSVPLKKLKDYLLSH